MRSIRQVFRSRRVRMGDIELDQPLPQPGLDMVDPFLLIHHWSDQLSGGQLQHEVGVGPHPHRGFAPVTFIFKGSLHHRDSTGKSDVVFAGGTQWMNSGNGIVHSERPAKELAQSGGDFELIQFWVNAPAARKMDPPSYQPLQPQDTPQVVSPDGKVKVAVVAGELNGVQGKIDTYSPLFILRFEIEPGGEMEVPVPEGFNALLYQLDGALTLNREQATIAKNLTWFDSQGGSIHLKGEEATRAILLAGQPLEEPIATYGPFVMNTQEEIVAAIQDYQMGRMGQLLEIFD